MFGEGGTGNKILGNSVFNNAGLSINLCPSLDSETFQCSEPTRVTSNDPGDADTGANNLQNFPLITTVTQEGGNIVISGTVTSTVSTQFRLEFFHNSEEVPAGFNEGETFLGSTDVTTDETGNADFQVTFPDPNPGGCVKLSATATDPDGNTSEFTNVPYRLRASTPSIMPQTAFAPRHSTLLYSVPDDVQASYLWECAGDMDLYVGVNGDTGNLKKMENQGPTDLGDADFHADDLHHSLWFMPTSDTDHILDLYVARAGEGTTWLSDRLELPLKPDPELAVLTDFRALFDEFREIGKSYRHDPDPGIEDKDQNDVLDFYDAVGRVRQYAEDHDGVVMDVRHSAYSAPTLDYYNSFNTRDGMATSIDHMVYELPRTINNVAVVGNDAVIPYRRHYSGDWLEWWYDDDDTRTLYTTHLVGLPTQRIIRQADAGTVGAEADAMDAGRTDPQAGLASPPISGSLAVTASSPTGRPTARRGLATSHVSVQTLDRSVVISHFEVQTDEQGRVGFTIPNNGRVAGQSFGPGLPMVEHAYLLPDATTDISVTLTLSQSHAYGQPVEMIPLTPVEKSWGPTRGTITLTNPYPETILGHRIYTDTGGLRLDVQLVPLQYDPDTGQVTLYDRVDYQIAYNVPTTYTLQSIVVNSGTPASVDQSTVPISVTLHATEPISGTLFWEIHDMARGTLDTSHSSVDLDPGSSQVTLDTDTFGWKPGPKQIIVALSAAQPPAGEGIIVATGHEVFAVEGRSLAVQADKPFYGPDETAATFTAVVLDETGAQVSGLAEDFTQQLDGDDLALTWSEGNSYTATLSLAGVITGQHTLTVTVSGELEATTSFILDRDPPTSTLSSPAIVYTSTFTVTVTGADDLSGVDTYYVQYREGESGAWTDWLTRTARYDYTHTGLDDLEPVFGIGLSPTKPATITSGTTYYFRVRAVDLAGNWEAEHSQADTSTYVCALTADFNDDGNVNIAEIMQIAARFGTSEGNPLYDPQYDLDSDRSIGATDLQLAAAQWRSAC